MPLKKSIQKLPPAYSKGTFEGRTYSLVRTDFNQGKSLKVFAEELGGSDFISFNFYQTAKGDLLKPCEMPEENVLQFLKHFRVNNVSFA